MRIRNSPNMSVLPLATMLLVLLLGSSTAIAENETHDHNEPVLRPTIQLQHATWPVPNLDATTALLTTLLPLEVEEHPIQLGNLRLKSLRPKADDVFQFELHIIEIEKDLDDNYAEVLKIDKDHLNFMKHYTNFIENHFAIRIHQQDIAMNTLDILVNQKFPQEVLDTYTDGKVPHFGPMQLTQDIYQFYVESPGGHIMELQIYHYDRLREEHAWLPPFRTWDEMLDQELQYYRHHQHTR